MVPVVQEYFWSNGKEEKKYKPQFQLCMECWLRPSKYFRDEFKNEACERRSKTN